MRNLSAFLTWQVPNRFTIEYHGKELKHHSLGQRASALILFILSREENDLFLIDQPEDDLDNQTIYEDVIKLIRDLKPNTQFLFATHNANFPVLGDAEQVHACSYSDDKIHKTSGSIDRLEIQQKIVKSSISWRAVKRHSDNGGRGTSYGNHGTLKDHRQG